MKHICILINRGGLKGKSKKLPKGAEAKGIQQNTNISGNISLRRGDGEVLCPLCLQPVYFNIWSSHQPSLETGTAGERDERRDREKKKEGKNDIEKRR